MRPLLVLALAVSFATATNAGAQGRERVRVGVNAGSQVGSAAAEQDFTFPLYLEDARVQNRIDLSGATFFDVGGAYRISRTLWAGIAFSALTRTTSSEMTATLPHPLYFELPRRVDATVQELEGREQGIHLSLMHPIAINRRLEIAIFGGPSHFTVTQDLVSGLNLDDTYPFEQVTIENAVSVSKSASAWGGHVGADVSWRLSPALRVGALVRFAKGSTALNTGNGDEVSISAGGLMAGAGVRVLF